MYEFQEKINPCFTYDNPFNPRCVYCAGNLKYHSARKVSRVPFKDFYRHFSDYVEEMEEIHGRFENQYFQINHSLRYVDSHLKRCPQCGWWSSYDQYVVDSSLQIWQVFYGVTGAIKNIDLHDLTVPDLEIRNHLIRSYNSRFEINPKKFEDVVSSIFRDLGFKARCTPYSRDGGIDILLETGDKLVAVQVKRTKNSIKLDQVRSFLGALVLNGINEGIYVSTSEFQRGCHQVATSRSINLFGGQRFYDILSEAQIIKYASENLPMLKPHDFHYYNCIYLNSL